MNQPLRPGVARVPETDARVLARALLDCDGALTPAERRAVERVARRVRVPDLNRDFEGGLTVGERLSDRLSRVGGSWGFILCFCGFLVAWAVLNAVVLVERAFDPFPFIFLNLILSCLAALQAPVILMAQNRQAAKDRMAAEMDYETNVRSEVEIMALHEKVDRMAEAIEALRAEAVAARQGRTEARPAMDGSWRGGDTAFAEAA